MAIALATPAYAVLQLSITANGQTFSCSDGEVSCDQSGGANNLLTIDTTVGGAFVELTLTQSTFGKPDSIQLSSSNIINESGAPISISFAASDTGFIPPVRQIENSGSLTFNNAVGSAASSLTFLANGTVLEMVSGTPMTDPDSFAGSNFAAFVANSPFSMEEQATLNLIAGGSITGFNQSMTTSGIPEAKTWAMALIGFAFLGIAGLRRKRLARFAAI
jgi:hypothetical protein